MYPNNNNTIIDNNMEWMIDQLGENHDDNDIQHNATG